MKVLIVSFCLVLQVTAVAASHQRNEIRHFQEEVAIPPDILDWLQTGWTPKRTDDLEEVVILERIINLGETVWAIIEKNKPVVNVKYTYANALPKGVQSSEELEGFSPIKARSFRAWGKNLYGMTVYDVTYSAVHRHNGSYSGVGKYLDSVSILPQKLDVAWGYTLDFTVEKISTVNVGTKENPIASLGMDVLLRVATVVKESQTRTLFDFRGDEAVARIVE